MPYIRNYQYYQENSQLWKKSWLHSLLLRMINGWINYFRDDVIKWKHICVTGPLCGEFTDHRWNPHTKGSDAELWCFLRSAPWINGGVNNRGAGDLEAIALIMTSLLWNNPTEILRQQPCFLLLIYRDFFFATWYRSKLMFYTLKQRTHQGSMSNHKAHLTL